MNKIILAILAFFLVTGFLVVDSQADYYRSHRRTTYWSGSAVVVSPGPYRYYNYSPRQMVYYSPPPVVYYSPAPVSYNPPSPWLPGISIFLPGVNIRIP